MLCDHKFLMLFLEDNQENHELAMSVYRKMLQDGTASIVFCDGSVSTEEEFASDVIRPGSLPFLFFWDGEPAGFVWLNTIEGKSARGHFVFFKSSWGRKTSVQIGKNILHYLISLKDEKGYLFDLLEGRIPKRNALAWKFMLAIGADKVGELPEGAFISSENKSEVAVITAVTREILRNKEVQHDQDIHQSCHGLGRQHP